jgi:hypothetical protein
MVVKKKKAVETDIINKNQYMLISFGYSCNMIMPYADGMKVMDGLARADAIEYGFSTTSDLPVIKSNPIDVSCKVVPERTFREAKVNLLLGLTDDDEEKEDT